MLGDSGGGTRQPFEILARFLKRYEGKKFMSARRRVPQWFQQSSGNQNWNVVHGESQIPGSLFDVQPRRGSSQTQKFLALLVHISNLDVLAINFSRAGPCSTQHLFMFLL